MKTVKKLAVITATIAVVAGTTFVAQAHNPTENDALGVNATTVTLNEAVSTALASVYGKATKADFSNDDGKALWEIEIIDSTNQVHDLEIDANSGVVVKNEIDTIDHEDDDEDEEHED